MAQAIREFVIKNGYTQELVPLTSGIFIKSSLNNFVNYEPAKFL